MTSKLTREQLHERARENVKALKMASRQTAFESAREEILADLQLAELALAAMDSEPNRNPVLAYADSYRDMAKQGVESVQIWSVITDLERNIAPLYRHAQQPVIPDGYVMVPKEPTKEMIDAGWLHFMGTKNASSKGTYKAMLAAAEQEVPDGK